MNKLSVSILCMGYMIMSVASVFSMEINNDSDYSIDTESELVQDDITDINDEDNNDGGSESESEAIIMPAAQREQIQKRLLTAVLSGNWQRAGALIQEGADVDWIYRYNDQRTTALRLAIEAADVAMVELLLGKDQLDEEYIKTIDKERAALLPNAGAQICLGYEDGFTLETLAQAYAMRIQKMPTTFLQQFGCIQQREIGNEKRVKGTLMRQSRLAYEKIVALLLYAHKKNYIRAFSISDFNEYAFGNSVNHFLIDIGNENTHQLGIDVSDYSPLTFSIIKGNVEAFNAVVALQASWFHCADEDENKDPFNCDLTLLLENGLNPNVKVTVVENSKIIEYPLLVYAAKNNIQKVVETLLDYGADIYQFGTDGYTIMPHAICSQPLLNILFKKPINLNKPVYTYIHNGEVKCLNSIEFILFTILCSNDDVISNRLLEAFEFLLEKVGIASVSCINGRSRNWAEALIKTASVLRDPRLFKVLLEYMQESDRYSALNALVERWIAEDDGLKNASREQIKSEVANLLKVFTSKYVDINKRCINGKTLLQAVQTSTTMPDKEEFITLLKNFGAREEPEVSTSGLKRKFEDVD